MIVRLQLHTNLLPRIIFRLDWSNGQYSVRKKYFITTKKHQTLTTFANTAIAFHFLRQHIIHTFLIGAMEVSLCHSHK